MTDREQIIAAAREAGMSGLEDGGLVEYFERFYAIALEHGRALEREECAKLSEKHDSYILASEIRARSTK